jgi:hypothetical protein
MPGVEPVGQGRTAVPPLGSISSFDLTCMIPHGPGQTPALHSPGSNLAAKGPTGVAGRSLILFVPSGTDSVFP